MRHVVCQAVWSSTQDSHTLWLWRRADGLARHPQAVHLNTIVLALAQDSILALHCTHKAGTSGMQVDRWKANQRTLGNAQAFLLHLKHRLDDQRRAHRLHHPRTQ